MRRNIVFIPQDLLEYAENIHTKQQQQPIESTQPTDGMTSALDEREQQLQDELNELQNEIRKLEQDVFLLSKEEQAIITTTKQFEQTLSSLSFLHTIPTTTVAPLQQTASQVETLRSSLMMIDTLQNQLEDKTRAYKQQKMETRDTFRMYLL